MRRNCDPDNASNEQSREDRRAGMKRRGRWPRLLARARSSPLFHRRFVHLGNMVPIDQVVEERFEIIRAAIAIIDVVGMLPDIAAENRLAAVYERVLAVRRLHDDDLAVLDRQPAPAGAELRNAGLCEVFLHLGQGADVGRELLLELAGKLVTAAALFHPLPKVDMIEMLGGIVEQTRDLAEGAFDDFFNRLVLPFRALGQIIAGRHVGLMVFVVMEFESFPRHMRRQRVVWIRKLGQRECHWSTPQCEAETAGISAGGTVLESEWFL